jgi:hypothetical protein
MAMSTIISLHLPKTAGTSFSKALEDHFGTQLLKDYADLPINTPVFERNRAALKAGIGIGDRGLDGITCVHGHFLPLKYLLLADKADLRFITWMRDPVERLLSHYYFWKRTYDPQNAPRLHRLVHEENWSIERFCLGPELRNLYGQFLWGFPLERFDFIGITEFYGVDLAFFSQKYLGVHLEPYWENAGGSRAHYRIDPGLRRQIEVYHAYDMSLYERALDVRLNMRTAIAIQK